MSKRLQVLFDEEELSELQEIARQNHMTLAEWVRQALREARTQHSVRGSAQKRQAVREAIKHDFPVTDIDELIEQIEQGYQQGSD